MKCEVVIVGKGIAGLTLSVLLSQKNIAHIVLYRKGTQQEMALGETLPPSAIPLIRAMGLLSLFEASAIQKTYGYHSVWGSTTVTDHNFYFQHPQAYGIKLDKQALLVKMENMQNDFLVSYDKDLSIQDHGAAVAFTFDRDGRTHQLHAKLIVDATGRNRAVLGRLGIGSIHYDDLTAYSCHLPRIKHSRLTHSVFSETFRDGWGIVSGLSAATQVLTLYTDRSADQQPKFSRFEHWANILSDTVYLKDFLSADTNVRVKGRLANSSKAAAITGKNWLALGDAAIALDPLSSHGITNALYTSMQAAVAVEQMILQNDESALKNYGRDLTAIFAAYLQTENKIYQQERRWLESNFWLNRHALNLSQTQQSN